MYIQIYIYIYVHVYFKEMMGYKSCSVPSVMSYTCNPRAQGCKVGGEEGVSQV